jgi:hypothetical protein
MSKFDDVAVVIRHKGKKFIASIPQLGLIAKADDANAALAAIEAKKKALIADLEEEGELDGVEIEDWSMSSSRAGPSKPAGDLGRFVLKAGIVTCCVIATLFFSGVLIASKVEQSVANTVNNVKSIKIGGKQFWTKVEDELDRMARPGNDLPEAKKKKLLADIQAIAAKWRPFAAELQSALADPNNLPKSDSTSLPK